jgi:hypothetical protein
MGNTGRRIGIVRKHPLPARLTGDTLLRVHAPINDFGTTLRFLH